MRCVSASDSIFAFESDFAGSLYCIPMAVRLKLDNCGVKVSLKQWTRLSREQRDQLLARPCDTAQHTQTYRDYLVGAIELQTGDKAQGVAVDPHPAWIEESHVPAQVSDYFNAQGLAPLSLAQWQGLAPLQRYALIKLTRPGHSNDNFLPALREFGCLSR